MVAIMAVQKSTLMQPLLVAPSLVILLIIASAVKSFEQSRAFEAFATIIIIAITGVVGWPVVRWMIGLGWKGNVVPLSCIFGIAILLGVLATVDNLLVRSLSTQAMDDLRSSDTVKEVLGGNVRAWWSDDIQYEETGSSGLASMSIPVSGNLGKGRLYVRGRKIKSIWTLDELYLVPNNSSVKLEIKH